jgi:hypothetical protein
MTDIHSCSYYCERPECIKAQRDELRDKLEQPEQEPVAWHVNFGNEDEPKWIMLSTPPAQPEQEPVIDKSAAIRIATALGWEPKREWVGLTNDECSDLYEAHHDKYGLPKQGSPDGLDYERAIEAKLKEKNT